MMKYSRKGIENALMNIRNSKTSSNANEADNEAERLTLEMIQKIDKALEQ